jgi:hypothetical protein
MEAGNLLLDANFPAFGLEMTLPGSLSYFGCSPAALSFLSAYAWSAAMPKEQKFKQQNMRTRIAAVAARIMAEDGIEDFAMAKRKAARQLGAGDTQSLPNNDEVETELRVYQSLYQGEEQRERLRYLRSQALAAMEQLADFNPYLTGPVLKGTAGRYADIDLQVFADSGKELEIFLLNRNIPYETSESRYYSGNQARAVSVLSLDWRGTPVRVAVYWPDDERRSVKTSPLGRPLERAGLDAVRTLVANGE